MEAEDKREKESFPSRGSPGDQPTSSSQSSRLHRLCQKRLNFAVNKSELISSLALERREMFCP